MNDNHAKPAPKPSSKSKAKPLAKPAENSATPADKDDRKVNNPLDVFANITPKQSLVLTACFTKQLERSLKEIIPEEQVREIIYQHLATDMSNAFSEVLTQSQNRKPSPAELLKKANRNSLNQESLQKQTVINEKIINDDLIDHDVEVKKSLHDLEKENHDLKAEIRELKEKIKKDYSEKSKRFPTPQKKNLTGRLLIHTLKDHYENLVSRPDRAPGRILPFFEVFPRSLYKTFIEEIGMILGEQDMKYIEDHLDAYIKQQKGREVIDLPDDDPIYDSDEMKRKSDILIKALYRHMTTQHSFSNYLENKLSKDGAKHSQISLIKRIITYGYETIVDREGRDPLQPY